MKLYNRIALAIIVLGLLGMAVGLVLLPDTVPVYYNLAGEVERWGSKYEFLLFPVMALLGYGSLLPLAQKAKEDGVRKLWAITAIFELLLFFGLGFYFMCLAGQSDPSMPAVEVDLLMKIISVFVGALLVVLGNIMPKARRNWLFGLRVSWTMESDNVWQRSQRFGGIASVAAGLLLIVLAIFLPGIWNLAALMVVLILWVAVVMAVSWWYHKEDQRK